MSSHSATQSYIECDQRDAALVNASESADAPQPTGIRPVMMVKKICDQDDLIDFSTPPSRGTKRGFF